MFRSEKTLRYRHKRDNPSFSSSLLDQICRSIDDNDGNGIADTKHEDLKFNRETMQKKQSKGSSMEKKGFEQASVEKKQVFKEFKRKSHHDVRFFSSSYSSSDSISSGGFSSFDTESIMYGTKTKPPSFVPKPARTSLSARPEKPLFTENRNLPTTKIYGNLKKVKQPISPGARLASFINSLFTTTGNNNTKKTKNPSSILRYDEEVSSSKTRSSASSFSRSCISKNSPSTREKLRDGVKQTVRFCPVSVIVEEDSRPCGQGSRFLPVLVPAAWKIGKSPSRKSGEEVKFQVKKSRRVEEIAREFLKGYHQNQKNNSRYVVAKMDEVEDNDDDAASDSSSDLFELDHLALKGNDRYREELPVYETTYVQTNRVIANGFIL